MALMQTILDLCRFVAVLSSGLPTKEEEGSTDTLESREHRATEFCQSHATTQLQQARQSLIVTSMREVCSLLPNFVVPLFALFRMSSATLALFGWGKRKRHTKKCAGAMAEFAVEFSGLVQTMLSCVERYDTERTSFLLLVLETYCARKCDSSCKSNLFPHHRSPQQLTCQRTVFRCRSKSHSKCGISVGIGRPYGV